MSYMAGVGKIREPVICFCSVMPALAQRRFHQLHSTRPIIGTVLAGEESGISSGVGITAGIPRQ
jgi:hypothetical protein